LKVGDRRQGFDTLLSAYWMGCREPNVLNTLALMWADDGTWVPALRIAEQAAELANESPTSLDTLGYVHLRLGQPDAALRYFERAIEESRGPGSRAKESVVAGYHFRKGLALRALGRVAEASSAFERARSLDPTRPLDPPPEPAIQVETGRR
jgi:tetratricopeptide (TPR) repeat protein